MCISFHFLKPFINMIKRAFRSLIKDHYDAISSSIISTGDGSKPLLSCSVPLNIPYNLEFYIVAFHLKSPETEIYADCADESVCEGIICEPEEQAGFTYCRVSDQYQFEQIVTA